MIIRAEKEWEELLDQILGGKVVVLPPEQRVIQKLVAVLKPIRRNGGLYIARDGAQRRTLIFAPAVRVVEKKRKRGYLEYWLRIVYKRLNVLIWGDKP